MTQFSCHAVRSGPGGSVHPHRKAHSGTEIGSQNLLLREAIFYYIPGQLQVDVAGKLHRAVQHLFQFTREPL